jgi:thioredoxin reductase (NADPH)
MFFLSTQNKLQKFKKMKEITASEFEKEVLQEKLVVVDFYSTECPPCEALAPKFESLGHLYGNDITFLKIYRQGNRELATQLGVASSPTLLFFENGKLVGNSLSGGIKRSEIVKQLDAMLPAGRVAEIKANIKPVESACETLILGGGPAGLAAGIYLAQAKVDTLLVDIALPGGQVSTTHLVSNYPGFIEPVNGYMLTHYMTEQTHKAGVKFKSAVDVSSVDLVKKEIVIDGFETIKFKKLVVATGASPRPLGIPGEKEFKGKGVSYCATCDAKYFNDKEVIIIGGGNSAVEESEFISKFASKITMVHQFDKLTANKEAQERCFANPKIDIMFECEPRGFEKHGDKMVVKVENLRTKAMETISADGIFVFVGMKANLDLLDGKFATDNWGYIKTDDEMRTSVKDVFAIGDVISKKYRQITTAVADGTIAAIAIAKELAD